MKVTEKTKSGLDKKYRKINETPASFAFFVAIHDFIECVESTPEFGTLLNGGKRYSLLTQIYQGIEDIQVAPTDDPGHSRYSVMRELGSIRNKDVSESNTFWKKRDALRKLTAEVYTALTTQPLKEQHA